MRPLAAILFILTLTSLVAWLFRRARKPDTHEACWSGWEDEPAILDGPCGPEFNPYYAERFAEMAEAGPMPRRLGVEGAGTIQGAVSGTGHLHDDAGQYR